SSMVPNRPDDKFGVGFIYAQYSDAVRNFDRDVVRLTATPGVIRDFEANIEINYQAQIIPGWIVQPNVQHIWHPSGDESRDATVVGVRSFMQ
ncbi:carbohydrate porin, partial [Vibrio parahaemolyticus]